MTPDTDKSGRTRVAIPCPHGVLQALENAAEILGVPVSQVALQTLQAGLPYLASQLEALAAIKR